MTGATLMAGCCGGLPQWQESVIEISIATASTTEIDISDWWSPKAEGVTASAGPDVLVNISGATLSLTPQPGFTGELTLTVTASDRCGGSTTERIPLLVEAEAAPPGACATTLTYRPVDADRVSIAGSFSEWAPVAATATGDGAFVASLNLEPGPVTYKWIEHRDDAFGTEDLWACDPNGEGVVCDPGTIDPFTPSFTVDCTPGAPSCNSLFVVPPCGTPHLALAAWKLDGDDLTATIDSDVGTTWTAVLDGAQVAADGPITASDLAPGRHTITVTGQSATGIPAESLHVPFWVDGGDWDDGLLYFAMVDRFANGDGVATPSGATAPLGEWHGGDLEGVRRSLDYLADLGTTALWITSPLPQPDGAWSGTCGTYGGYHGYWPTSETGVDGRLGDAADLAALVDDAHDRGIRVILDAVLNHVHADSPHVLASPEWFGPYDGCLDTIDGALGFDRNPEGCWFSPYLPDIDYANSAVMATWVQAAVDYAIEANVDGLRVDAVKHFPHATTWNLEAEIARRIEHAPFGVIDFWTVGETFDGADRIAAYLGEGQLDGQFDFPMYWAIRSAFAHDGDYGALIDAALTSQSQFAGSRMSVFLGNHDVARFVTEASGDDGAVCVDGTLQSITNVDDPLAYARLRNAMTWVLTQPGVPLVYYGDEVGLPGLGDPDNRQPLWSLLDPIDASNVDDVADQLDANRAESLRHVRDVTAVRRSHPALRDGTWVEWWRESAIVGFARVLGNDAALVLISRDGSDRTLTNGLSFAGLPDTTYVDAVTGEVFEPSGGQISVTVRAWSSRILVPK